MGAADEIPADEKTISNSADTKVHFRETNRRRRLSYCKAGLAFHVQGQRTAIVYRSYALSDEGWCGMRRRVPKDVRGYAEESTEG